MKSNLEHDRLIPEKSWSPELARRYTNARAETLLSRASFAPAMQKGYRCVVPLSAFYERRARDGRKVRYRVSRKDGKPLLAAGVHSPCGRVGSLLTPSCAIVTCPANADLAELHDRMPALLLQADVPRWPNRQTSAEAAQELAVKPVPVGVLQFVQA